MGLIGALIPPAMFWGEYEMNTLANPDNPLPHIWPKGDLNCEPSLKPAAKGDLNSRPLTSHSGAVRHEHARQRR